MAAESVCSAITPNIRTEVEGLEFCLTKQKQLVILYRGTALFGTWLSDWQFQRMKEKMALKDSPGHNYFDFVEAKVRAAIRKEIGIAV